jgi:ferredoxin
MAMRILVDQAKCIGSGNCVLAAPDVFTQDEDDGTVVVIDSEPDASVRAAVEAALETCSTRVITVRP